VNLYPRPPEVVVAFAAQPGPARPKALLCLLRYRMLDMDFRERFFYELG
jgi:hypothetical protein